MPLSGSGWRLGGGAKKLVDVLTNTTDLQIRGEFILGAAEAGLAGVELVGSDNPSARDNYIDGAVGKVEDSVRKLEKLFDIFK